MASSALVKSFRKYIGDTPSHAFNEAVADGINASWVLTNKPLEMASESVFLDGVPQFNGEAVAVLIEDVSENSDSIIVSALDNLPVGTEIFINSAIDPRRYKILSIDTSTNEIVLNRDIDQDFASGSQVFITSKLYEISSRYGIVYFDSAPSSNVLMTIHFEYFEYEDVKLSGVLDNAINEVSIDIGSSCDPEADMSHRALCFLRAFIALIETKTIKSSGSAIKVKQGSTSLDLVGANQALQKQGSVLRAQYDQLLGRYLMGQLDDSVGTAVVGEEGLSSV